MAQRPHPDRIVAELWPPRRPERETVFAVLDGARDERIAPAVQKAGLEHACLYRGELAQTLSDVAPYLVALEPRHEFTRWLLTHGWGQSWGIFAVSQAPLADLRRHFRKFLMVYDETGKPLYFRFYDPRVLRIFLPTCDADQLQSLFGPILRYVTEDEDGTGLLIFRATDPTPPTPERISLERNQ
jgi:hypothetical protein